MAWHDAQKKYGVRFLDPGLRESASKPPFRLKSRLSEIDIVHETYSVGILYIAFQVRLPGMSCVRCVGGRCSNGEWNRRGVAWQNFDMSYGAWLVSALDGVP